MKTIKECLKATLPHNTLGVIAKLKRDLLHPKNEASIAISALRKGLLKKPLDKGSEVLLANICNGKLRYTQFPYFWVNEYSPQNFPAQLDKECSMYYVEKNGLRLYFPKRWYKWMAEKQACEASLEMDLRSPHRYVTKENNLFGTINIKDNLQEKPFYVKKGDIVADIGCSHANFALSVADIAEHIYLFEVDPVWNEPLRKTFEKYKDKVTIINKFVSDKDTENSVCLDTFFKNRQIDFIKADIEGYELQFLQGSKGILLEKNIKISICTYHKPQDEVELYRFLRELGYIGDFTNGYMLCIRDNTLFNSSFLRKAVLRMKKAEKGL